MSTLVDPRQRSNFVAQYYPRVNGKDAPPVESAARNDRIILEFLAVYYDLNCEYSRLLQVRQDVEVPERDPAVRERLQAIEKVLIVRDALEDRYAPLGIVAEPSVQDGFAIDLKMTFGNVNALGRRRTDEYTIDAFVPIPMPKGLKLEDLPIHVEGPGITPGY